MPNFVFCEFNHFCQFPQLTFLFQSSSKLAHAFMVAERGVFCVNLLLRQFWSFFVRLSLNFAPIVRFEPDHGAHGVDSAFHRYGVDKSSTSCGWGYGGNVASVGWQLKQEGPPIAGAARNATSLIIPQQLSYNTCYHLFRKRCLCITVDRDNNTTPAIIMRLEYNHCNEK